MKKTRRTSDINKGDCSKRQTLVLLGRGGNVEEAKEGDD